MGLERGYIFHLGTLQLSPCRVNQAAAVRPGKDGQFLFFFLISEGRKDGKKCLPRKKRDQPQIQLQS